MKEVVQTNIGIESCVFCGKGGKHEKEWVLWINAATQLMDIEDFYDAVEAIFKDCIKAYKKDFGFKVKVYKLEMFGDGSGNYNEWLAVSCDQDGEGLYFRPNTTYTDEARDFYLQKNSLRKDIARALVY